MGWVEEQYENLGGRGRYRTGALPVGDGEGDKGCVSVHLQDEGLCVGQLGPVRKPWLPIPANHCVCKAQEELMGCSVCSMHTSPHCTSMTL